MDMKEVKKVVVVGAGVMGHSIAQVFAQAGIRVALVDVEDRTLEHAIRLIKGNLNTMAELGRIQRDQVPNIVGLVHPTTDLASAAAKADFALETVVEVPEVKKEVFSRLAEACPQGTILASNTSGLDIFDIVDVPNPERLVAAHWFAPPHIIPLVEVVPGPATSSEAITFTADLMERIGKKPVVMKQFVRSFIVNRIQNAISMAVWEILLSGWATPEEVDLAVKASLGIRLPIVGVVQTLDFTGLDLVHQITKNLGMENKVIEEKYEKGYLGVKTSKGIYDYGGRSEEEILKKRDTLYFIMLDKLEEATGFKPV